MFWMTLNRCDFLPSDSLLAILLLLVFEFCLLKLVSTRKLKPNLKLFEIRESFSKILLISTS